jgi:3-phosphoshikimate 1-carboxyvinyltransferase
MDRIAVPLGAMGAIVQGRGTAILPPLVVGGGGLTGIEWTPPMASAQVKSCILFAGLYAAGETVVREPVATRAHTEEMLAQAGADIAVEPWGAGRSVRVRRSRLHPLDIDVPGDPSQAAFWLVAACVTPGSSVRVEHVYSGRDRIGYLSVLERMGASVALEAGRDGTATFSAEHSALRGTEVDAAEIPSLDEVPILAVAATAAQGTTTFRNVGELAVKESDRLAATIALVEALGGRASSEHNVLVVEGAGRIGPGAVRYDSRGDHRLAMAGIVGALASPAGGVVGGVRSVETSYRGFLDDLATLAGPGAWEPADGPERAG